MSAGALLLRSQTSERSCLRIRGSYFFGRDLYRELNGSVPIGLVASDWGGQGRMTQAVQRMTEFGFRQLGLHRIEAACVPENEASARVLLRAGFEEEGFARGYLRIDGRWRDHRLFAIGAS